MINDYVPSVLHDDEGLNHHQHEHIAPTIAGIESIKVNSCP